MSMLLTVQAIILGIVQGITEWLPISSTGHMILVNEFLKMNVSESFMDTFLVVIQFGSILAVVALYFNKLNPFSPSKSPEEKRDTYTLWLNVIIAVIPAGVIGVLFDDAINSVFYNSYTVAATLIIYGVLFIVIENARIREKYTSFDSISFRTAFLIGVFQVLALIPGTSRSGSTILGASIIGCSRAIAAEFSFFLAIPVMLGASALKLAKAGFAFSPQEWGVLAVGMITAFAVSVAAIKFLMSYIRKHDFKGFGYYRIILGIIVLAYFMLR